MLVITSFAVRNGFRGNRYVINDHNPRGRINGPLTNCLYFPSLFAEQNVFELAAAKSKNIIRAFGTVAKLAGGFCLSTQSATQFALLADCSVDYIFIDPPFGSNIMYSEMNFLVETWLGCVTNNKDEAIVNDTQKKDQSVYRGLMTKCLQELYRVLKPGRWLTMEFHNSKNAIWNVIQTALGDAGFVIADVRILDKGKPTVYQEYYVSGATKRDLVISAYKPNERLASQFALEAGTEHGTWEFVSNHLRQLPVFVGSGDRGEFIAERQHYLLFDRMVAFHVQRSVSVPLSASAFHAGLQQRYAERDGMFFLPEQIVEYDRRRMAVQEVVQLEMFVSNELSAIQWVKQQLGKKPQTFQELQPQFMREVAGWQKYEKACELIELLGQNFLCFDGRGDVPSQIHSYLSTSFHELRSLEKSNPNLVAKAKNRWYVPDTRKEADLEKIRHRTLIKEFEEYRRSKGKLKVVRTEALRAGFKNCWQIGDYQNIVEMAKRVKDEIIQEDAALLMYFDNALMRTEE